MIELENVSFRYESTERESGVFDLNLKIPTGQVVLLCGASGCGKSTLTRIINKLIPEYFDGKLTGRIKIDGEDVSEQSLYEFDGKVGTVFQNPRSQFFNTDVVSEIAFGCENYGVDPEEILCRIRKAVSELKIESLTGRTLFELSGGEKQKVACASVSAMLPEILILDEPSSNLDIATIADLKSVLEKWKAMGKTIIIAEHRIYYLVDVIDRVIYMDNGTVQYDWTAEEFRNLSETTLHSKGLRSLYPMKFSNIIERENGDQDINFNNLSMYYGKKQVVNIPSLNIPKGAIVGILGHNGAGKTSFAKCLCGLDKRSEGSFAIDGEVISDKQRLKKCYMVMQDVNHQLFTESVEDEILLSLPDDEGAGEESELVDDILTKMNLKDKKTLHPMSLSGGQKQRVAIGSAIASGKEIIVFDEPTSGLDYYHMVEVAKNLLTLSEMGKTLFIITHDPELIALCCNYFVFIEDGGVKWHGGWTDENISYLREFFSDR